MTDTDHNPPTGPPVASITGQGQTISPRQLGWIGAAFGLLTLPAFLIDRQVASWIAPWDADAPLMRIVNLFRFPGSFLVALGIGAVILLLDRSARRKLLRLGTALIAAEVVTGVFKAIFSRQRPSEFDLQQGIGSSFPGFFHSLTQDNQGVGLLERSLGGFPSGHVTCAVVAAIGLGWLYPRHRWLFLAIPLLVAFQRLAFEQHFLSDLTAAAAVGSLVTASLLHSQRLGGWFDGFERRAETTSN